MTLGSRSGLLVVAAALLAIASPMAAIQQRGDGAGRPLSDFDVRDGRPLAAPSAGAAAELARTRPATSQRSARLHPRTGAVRVLDSPGESVPRNASAAAIRSLIASMADRLGLDRTDLSTLDVVRDYVSASNGVRHVVFSQSFDGIPVFDAMVAVHVNPNGDVVRVTSSAAPGGQRSRVVVVAAGEAAAVAAANVRPDLPFAASRLDGPAGLRQITRFARGPFLRDVTSALTWLPMDGGLRLTWQVDIEPEGEPQLYDLLVDATTGEVLLRRNRVRYAEGSGRVLQSAAVQALDPRRPDPAPSGNSGCPPPQNHELRSLTSPFRDPSTILFGTGRLEGNNTHAFLGASGTEADAGTFDGTAWSFDFPFNSSGAAAANLFFAVNYAHDFFYDLGFDEAAGNFQQDNFGRGGIGGDSIHAVARAAGRNNATFQPEPEGTSPRISMFLWDGTGCWGQDVDGDGSVDLDGDYDLDIVVHEFHHGVTHRLNTAFSGSEADAIGEGGGDFFAYSINGDTTLADYARPGGIRGVNPKTYADWSCFLGFFCEPHANGEIFANVMWDVRERFRTDLVRGSEAAAVNESHQLYIDALKLSPPSPTMLDVRDAMVLADGLRNPGTPRSENFCRIWEPFAARGMGVNATDTADNGSNQVQADYSVPEGCEAPPPPPTVFVTVETATATEAGPTNGRFLVSRGQAQNAALTVNILVSGTAASGIDYLAIPATVTIPAGAASANVDVTPIDDDLVENNESVSLTLRSGTGYLVGAPVSGTVTVVSDDLAPDFVVSTLTVPLSGGAGLPVQVTDTTKNQGTGQAAASVTVFYLSTDVFLDASDPQIGSRNVPELAVGATSTASTTVTLPSPLPAGLYRIFAKADGPGTFAEISEQNNLRSASIRVGPDLVVSSLSAPGTAGAGATLVVTDTTTNQGAGAADASHTRFYLSANSTWDEGDTPLQARSVGPLDAGAASSGSTSVVIPAGTATATYYLIAKADAAAEVGEATETNNTRGVVVRVGPDLQVSALSAPARGASGGTVSVSDTTANKGAGSAGPSVTAFYLSSNYLLDASDVKLPATRTVGPLSAGGSSSGVTDVTLPTVTAGTWYLIAKADDLAAVDETVETNNTRYRTIAIGPDLDVVTLTAPSTVVAGATFSVSDSVKNIGAEGAPASITRLYLSADTVLDGSDTVLGERSVGPLAANASSLGSTPVVAPTGLSGRYYLIAVADGAGTIPETSELNNSLWRAVTINP